MKNTVVIDMDGTLADVSHRRHLVSGKKRNYEAFHAGIENDPVNEWCFKLMCAMKATGWRIVIVSARPHSVIESTKLWLGKNCVPWDELYILRPDGDSTPDQELKRKWLQEYGKGRILFVVDDRQKVVDMWRAEGIVCLQCDDWKEK